MSSEDIKNKELEQEIEPSETTSESENTDTLNQENTDQTTEEVELQEGLSMAAETIKKLEEELASAKDSVLRKAAELENVRKRVQRERVAIFEDSKIEALQEFLPISEDIFRVLGATEEYEVDESFKSGVKLVADKFEEVFSKYGVEVISETGIPFDVNLHDALLRQPSQDENIESNTVLQILENGYKIGNKVIKHAKVIVSE